jgi:CheY-like chemotaxis protein
VVANSGAEALDALQAQHFDAVLMDVQMPEMDGLEATASIRAQEETTGDHIPIIAMTAHVMQGDRERCLEAGMDDYLGKPIQAETLFAALTRLLPEVISTHAATAPPVAAEVEAPAAALFDKAATRRRVASDWDLLREVVALFREACTEMLLEIDSAIADRDAIRLRRLAHTLKGEASNFGAAATVEAALRLEIMGRDEDLTEAEVAYAALQSALEQLLPALLAFGEVGELEEEPT